MAFLNEDDDAPYTRPSLARSSFKEEGAEALNKIGTFFKNTGGLIAKKYEETDFKALGQKISTKASEAGKTVVETTENLDVQLTKKVEEIKESEETKNAVMQTKTKWSALRTKVKGIFTKNEDSKAGLEPQEGPVEDDGSPVPDMLRLEG